MGVEAALVEVTALVAVVVVVVAVETQVASVGPLLLLRPEAVLEFERVEQPEQQ